MNIISNVDRETQLVDQTEKRQILSEKIAHARAQIVKGEKLPISLKLGKEEFPTELLNEENEHGQTILDQVNPETQSRIYQYLKKLGAVHSENNYYAPLQFYFSLNDYKL